MINGSAIVVLCRGICSKVYQFLEDGFSDALSIVDSHSQCHAVFKSGKKQRTTRDISVSCKDGSWNNGSAM